MAWDELTARQVELARRAGALSLLPVALDDRIHADLFCGRLAAAIALAAEADAVVEATGSHLGLRGAIALANWRGEEAEALALIEARRQDVLRRGEGLWLAATDWGTRSSTTASAATTTPWPPPSGPPRTRAASAPRCGCWPTSSRPPSAAASRSAPPARSRG